ncbi:hypothetical protein ANCCAN_27418 [Ancylostoma caninum]|uniref:Uncharacterized protein n=1 Tax=Ancylostoma caninum TaxID=29170 RepID=A0A368F417_ANCCA|nr:hypothetical protein ANCCAN_27418 [Ancylostoma caninum]
MSQASYSELNFKHHSANTQVQQQRSSGTQGAMRNQLFSQVGGSGQCQSSMVGPMQMSYYDKHTQFKLLNKPKNNQGI